MTNIHKTSLAKTLDSVSESLFFRKPIHPSERREVAAWIAERYGKPGSYANMFAPMPQDFKNGIKLFTGEEITSRVAVAHILGEDCCRILPLLETHDAKIEKSLHLAIQSLTDRLNYSEERSYGIGMYCCGRCSTAYWRNLVVNHLPRWEERLREGMKALKKLRVGDSKWKRFPFYATCLALVEIGEEIAGDELRYCAPFWEKNLKKIGSSKGTHSKRRFAVGERLLEMCR